VSTKSSIWYGEDNKGNNVHIYWELAERVPGVAAPIYIEIEVEGKETAIRLPKDVGEKFREAFGCCDDLAVL